MTAPRRDGHDTPIGRWIRTNCTNSTSGFVTTDVDYVVHRYRTDIYGEGVGTREIQHIMFCEFKTYGAKLNLSQQETLFWYHLAMRFNPRQMTFREHTVQVCGWGVSVIECTGTSPDDGSVRWGRFSENGDITFVDVEEHTLAGLVDLDRDPDDPSHTMRWRLRPHHKTTEIIRSRKEPLGFTIWEKVPRRS